MRRILSLFAMLMLCGASAFAQNRVVTGQVFDDAKSPLSFATILVKGTKVGIKADENGNFTVKNLQADAVLEVSATGFTSQEVPTSGKSNVVVTLEKKDKALVEVVLSTQLGQVRQKSSLGYAATTIKSAELVQGKATNLQNGLTGKVSGLNVSTVNNGVFGDTRITIRGIRSLTGSNQPMLILDGVPLSLGYLSSINPNDIAEVTVLKSASALTLYGPEGVNGAIVVTTKKGSKIRPQVTVSHATQWETVSFMPKFQTQWGSGYDQDPVTGQGTYTPYEQQSWGDAFDGSIRVLGEGVDGGDTLRVPYSYVENGRKNFFNTGLTHQSDVSYSTGDFYMSAQNVDISGITPGDVNNRRAITFRSEKEYGKFKAIFNVRYTQTKYDVTTQNRLVYYGIISAPGQIDVSKFSDWRNDPYSNPNGYYTTYIENAGKTPYFVKDNNRQVGKTDDIFGNVELNYKATSWLNFTYRVGLTVTNADATSTTGAFSHSAWYKQRGSGGSGPSVTAAVSDANSYSNRLTSEFFANFNQKWGDFGLAATLGYSFRESRTKSLSVGSTNLGQSTFLNIATRLNEPSAGFSTSKLRVDRFFGKVSLDYKKWAFLEGSFSNDRDSRLAPADPAKFNVSDVTFFYPSVSASFLLHEVIPGFKNNNVINFLKLRGSIAKSGSLTAIDPYFNETSFSVSTFFPFGSTAGYLRNNTIYNITKPEFVNGKDVGIELGFFKNRINFEATYYEQNNTDQILSQTLSNTTGSTVLVSNAGDFVNRGWELDLKLTPLIKFKEVSLDLKLNYTRQTNEVTKLAGGLNELGIGNYNFLIVGKPAYTFKMTDYVRDAQGRVVVYNAQGEMPNPSGGVFTGPAGMPRVDESEKAFGSNLPTDIFGVTLSGSWKNLTFSINAEYRGGNQFISDDLGAFLDDNGISARSGADGRRAFIFPNSVYYDGSGKTVANTNVFTENYGRLFYNDDLNTGVISNYLASAAFWKIREIAVTYELPAKLFKKSLKGVSVGVSARNLVTWVPSSNQWTDPEFSNTTGNAQGRNTAGNLPPTRFFGANVIFKF